MKIITGYTGGKHITPADDAGFIKGILGSGDYVLPTGSQFEATIQSNSAIRLADGELAMQGRHARIDSAYVDVTITNGSQGMYRNDLIVARYSKNTSTGVESIELVVITGTASKTALDPDHRKGDIDNGESRDFPLYRVKLNGVTIEAVEKLWATQMLPIGEMGLRSYPIGAVYISYVETSPAELFGGEWQPITGVFPYFNAGTSTGGSNTHTLTIAQMPSHTHSGYVKSTPEKLGGGSTYSRMNDNGATASNALVINSTGGGQAHNNMPAYQTFYAWRRIA